MNSLIMIFLTIINYLIKNDLKMHYVINKVKLMKNLKVPKAKRSPQMIKINHVKNLILKILCVMIMPLLIEMK